jgi:hypothetical protein
MWRCGTAAIVMLGACAAFVAQGADAATKKKPPRPAQITEQTAPRQAGEPIMAIVSIKSQQVTFYDADGWIVRAPVSTGVKGRETPAGVFAVIEKDKDHHSSMYDDAWMPNMQRITWNGLALHGGPLPGYAASHGCIRMPYGFAEKMFDQTQIGMRVIISPVDAAPVDFSHPALFVPNPEAIAAAPMRAETLAGAAADAVTAADEAKKAASTAAREASTQTKAVRNLEALKTRADAQLASADKALAAAQKAFARAKDTQQKAADKATDLMTELDGAKADLKARMEAATATADAGVADDEAKDVAATAVREAASLTASMGKLEALKARADAEVASADKAFAAAEKGVAKAEDLRQKAAAKVADLAVQLDVARPDAASKLAAVTTAKDAAKAADGTKAEAAKAASEAKLALEPVSVYISRATQKLYVRRNTHKPFADGGEIFDSSIEVPVTIRDPDKPIGTHIFTAMAASDTALRWTAVTIDAADDATDALDRITIPQDVLDRIAPTALPRSSIIVSDEPLSRETNYRTEFVAVLSDQPQGGFITRKPTPPIVDQGGGFFSIFQQNPRPNFQQYPRTQQQPPYPGAPRRQQGPLFRQWWGQ